MTVSLQKGKIWTQTQTHTWGERDVRVGGKPPQAKALVAARTAACNRPFPTAFGGSAALLTA